MFTFFVLIYKGFLFALCSVKSAAVNAHTQARFTLDVMTYYPLTETFQRSSECLLTTKCRLFLK